MFFDKENCEKDAVNNFFRKSRKRVVYHKFRISLSLRFFYTLKLDNCSLDNQPIVDLNEVPNIILNLHWHICIDGLILLARYNIVISGFP